MTTPNTYRISGSYYEACNCEAICPCRRQGSAPGGRSTYDDCDFVLSWRILDGQFGDTDISDLLVSIAGTYNNDVGDDIWSIHIYIDERASEEQFAALEQIFRGDAGGNFAVASRFSTILGVKPAAIRVDHTPGAESVEIASTASANVVRKFEHDGTVSCGIPGHDHPGQESVSNLAVEDAPLSFSYSERCGFATDFAYWN
ncbi:DUF1326 domain-containing protein [Alphaproteobacteria bacterium GH1-50]|uniref:DUF1326 domain-containing protein n=1 Tax=Kangsaoukella pontilimi TaxID=2691042 RepID=A0A7C9J1M4_9RHOB|nr:DUF1326 domain-containing protein [Kangsaoukella pontilimi]MXQ06921.1 DUF1326 domain-containing protein [Kangsaoukella pontilimi]